MVYLNQSHHFNTYFLPIRFKHPYLLTVTVLYSLKILYLIFYSLFRFYLGSVILKVPQFSVCLKTRSLETYSKNLCEN